MDSRLLADVPGKGGDGRPVARPADPGLGMSFAGIRISALTTLEGGTAAAGYDFTQASGWWRPEGGEPVTYTGQFPGVGVILAVSSGTLWCLHSWKEAGLPVELYAAPGKWTLLACHGCRIKPRTAIHQTLMPPDADGQFPVTSTAGERKVRVAARYGEGSLVRVSLVVHGVKKTSPPTGAPGSCQASWTQAFAAMMTWRFGEPLEVFADLAAIQDRVAGRRRVGRLRTRHGDDVNAQ